MGGQADVTQRGRERCRRHGSQGAEMLRGGGIRENVREDSGPCVCGTAEPPPGNDGIGRHSSPPSGPAGAAVWSGRGRTGGHLLRCAQGSARERPSAARIDCSLVQSQAKDLATAGSGATLRLVIAKGQRMTVTVSQDIFFLAVA